CLNGSAEIIAHVAGGSGNFVFTWYSAASAGGPWDVISGETDSVYAPPTGVVGQRYYRVYVEDLIFDCNDAMSNAVVFYVLSDPQIQIAMNDVSLCAGGLVTLTPVITGRTVTLTYQWQSSTTGTGGWDNVPGATSQN